MKLMNPTKVFLLGVALSFLPAACAVEDSDGAEGTEAEIDPEGVGVPCEWEGEGCGDGLLCTYEKECQEPSPYPDCGWHVGLDQYYCSSLPVLHEVLPIECPDGLEAGEPCGWGKPINTQLTPVGCCDHSGAWWCDSNSGKVVHRQCPETW